MHAYIHDIYLHNVILIIVWRIKLNACLYILTDLQYHPNHCMQVKAKCMPRYIYLHSTILIIAWRLKLNTSLDILTQCHPNHCIVASPIRVGAWTVVLLGSALFGHGQSYSFGAKAKQMLILTQSQPCHNQVVHIICVPTNYTIMTYLIQINRLALRQQAHMSLMS